MRKMVIGLLIIISIGLILITPQFLKKQKTSEANTKNLVSNDNSKQNEVKPKDLDLIGKWYSSDWDKILEISELKEGYNFHFTDDTTNDDVELIKQNKNMFVFQSIESEYRVIYEIEPINNNKFTYKAKTSDTNGIGQTRMVTFQKQEE